MGAIDLGCIGTWHTWSNEHKLQATIHEGLDRVLASALWCLAFPMAKVKSFWRSSSEHSPILMDTFVKNKSFQKPFRFFDAWASDPSSRDIVPNAWELHVSGVESFKLTVRLGNTKHALKVWSKTTFCLCQITMVNLELQLQAVQNKPPLPETIKEEKELQESLSKALDQLDSVWKQKLHELWTLSEDRNTHFFHASMLIRRKRNSILAIKNSQDVWLHSVKNFFGD